MLFNSTLIKCYISFDAVLKWTQMNYLANNQETSTSRILNKHVNKNYSQKISPNSLLIMFTFPLFGPPSLHIYLTTFRHLSLSINLCKNWKKMYPLMPCAMLHIHLLRLKAKSSVSGWQWEFDHQFLAFWIYFPAKSLMACKGRWSVQMPVSVSSLALNIWVLHAKPGGGLGLRLRVECARLGEARSWLTSHR